MDLLIRLEAHPEESSSCSLTQHPSVTSVQDEKNTGKSVKKWSKTIIPLASETIHQAGLHPACLEFAPIDPTHYDPMTAYDISKWFVVGLYNILPEKAKDAEVGQEASQRNSPEDVTEAGGQHSTETVEGVAQAALSRGEASTNRKVSKGRKQERQGGISLYTIRDKKLVWVEDSLKNYGVYDLKFLPYHQIFAASTTVGTIVIYRLKAKLRQRDLTLKRISVHKVLPGKNLITSIAWQPLRDATDATRVLAITADNSGVFLLRFSQDFDTFELLNHRAPLHEHVLKTRYFETKESAYTCAFSIRVPDKVFSGGDDSLLRVSTLSPCICPCQKAGRPCTEPSPHDERMRAIAIAESGIVSILLLPIYNSRDALSILLVGSYDGNVYLCTISDGKETPGDTRYPLGFKSVASFSLGGGVYNMKFLLPYVAVESRADMEISFRFLACCMDAGAKIVEVVRNKHGVWSFSLLGSYEDLVYVNEDKLSVCYAGDVQPVRYDGAEEQPPPEYGGGSWCVTSSYDDSKLSLWWFVPD